jgi:spore coat protein CotF
MQLASHEAHDLQELALSCVNSITNMALFINQAKDAELKSMIQRQFSAHIQDYNIKVEYLSKPDGTTMKLQVPQLSNTLPSSTQSSTSPEPVTPRTDVKELNDREIATAYLLTLKRAGREYAWAAMEASNQGIRAFLEDAFTMASHHAYEVWQWMVKKGYYALQPAPQATLDTFGEMYKPVQMPQ